MFARMADSGRLEVRAAGDDASRTIPMAGFTQVSALRWCPHHQHLLVTAVARADQQPDVRAGRRGDLRLFRTGLDEPRWEQLGSGYAHDPVCLPEGGYAVHRGAGITFLTQDGSVLREVRVGQFNWGPPSLSVNPTGDRVAWTRWVGDERKLRVENVASGESFQARTSLFRYGWWDDRRLVFYFGSGLRLLDTSTSTTRALRFDLARKIREGLPDAPDALRELAAQEPAVRQPDSFDDLYVTREALWFTGQLASRRGGRVQGVYRLDRISGELSLVLWTTGDERIGHFEIAPDGSCAARVDVYKGATVVGRRLATTGPSKNLLSDGWTPVATSDHPSFGFHQLPV